MLLRSGFEELGLVVWSRLRPFCCRGETGAGGTQWVTILLPSHAPITMLGEPAPTGYPDVGAKSGSLCPTPARTMTLYIPRSSSGRRRVGVAPQEFQALWLPVVLMNPRTG